MSPQHRTDPLWRALQAAALRREKSVERYGLIGVIIFEFSPFWLTGPVIGCVLGYLIGLKPWRNMAVVISGTLLAILSWGLFLENIHDRLAKIHSWAPFVLLCMILILIGLGHLSQRGSKSH